MSLGAGRGNVGGGGRENVDGGGGEMLVEVCYLPSCA